MIRAKFSNKMIEQLAKLKGSIFVKYFIDNQTKGASSYCKVGIDSTNVCLDIYNEETSVDWFATEDGVNKEDISVFSCKVRKDKETFKPYIEESEVLTIAVNERIKEIYIISDIIDVNNGEYTIDYDIAVVIETEEHKYIFSRGWFFNEEIYINIDKDIDDIYPIKEVIESWNNDSEFTVDVSRKVGLI